MSVRDVTRRATTRSPLPEGSLPVGVGLLVAGVTAYGFLVLAGRALGPERYASLSALWFLFYFIGPGFFLPLEQEVGRVVAARRAIGSGARPVVRRALAAGAVLATALAIVTLAGSGPLSDRLFDHEGLLLVSFVAGLFGLFAFHLGRGVLAGNGRFRAYGTAVGADGTARFLACAVLFAVGVQTPGPFGLCVTLSPFVGIGIALAREKGLVDDGPEAPWRELSSNLGYLLIGAVLSMLLVNAAPLTAKVLASDAEQEIAGRFTAGVILARIPVFLFQAVQAALLPKLAGLASARRHDEFRVGMRRLILTMTAFGVVSVLGASTVGPWALRVLFGDEFALGHRDLGLLAAASVLFMITLALAQALIALDGHAAAAAGWTAAVITFFVALTPQADLLLRVEQAYVLGASVGTAAMAALLWRRMQTHAPTDGALAGVLAPDYVEP